MENPKTSIVLGAGFSYVAGLPMASQLFATSDLPPTRSQEDKEKMQDVQFAFQAWVASNPRKNAEEWLRVLYTDKDYPLSKMIHGTIWEDAVGFGLRRLTTVKSAHPEPYYYGISRHVPDSVHPSHKKFWQFVESLNAKNILTLNYDLLVEQALHRIGHDGKFRPRFSYGGFPFRQVVKKMKNVSTRSYEDVLLGSEYLVYKLHGSLNWAQEHHSSNMKVHDDVRAVFRTTDNVGVPAIVPPIPEKELPRQFSRIWGQAEKELENSEIWIVCGYSMPDYDEALREWFQRVLTVSKVRRIAILDPKGGSLMSRWQHPDRLDVEVAAFPGLPDCLGSDLTNFVLGK